MKSLNSPRSILISICVLLLGGASLAGADQAAAAPWDPPAREIALYPGIAPGSENWNWGERVAGTETNPQVQNVVRPELMYYPADKATAVGTAVIVAPGGGFRTLMMSYEGVTVAKRFNQMGVDAFVLKYRLIHTDSSNRPTTAGSATQPSTPGRKEIEPIAAADGQQAIRLLRQNAADYGFSPVRIGIIGFSAGGAVAVHTVRGQPDGRPNFACLIYASGASGDPPPEGAPPIFLAVAADDQQVGFQHSLDMFSAWRKANIPVELHIFQMGGHGFAKKGGGADHYLDRVEEWMRVNGFLRRESSPG